MELFIDSVDIDEVRQAASLGVITGCTTNPKLAASAEPGDFRKRVEEILTVVDGPVSVEVLDETVPGMLTEAAEYASWDASVVVKIPMCLEGLEVIHKLERERDVRVNVTCMMNSNQAAMAMMAGATYVSLFVGRISDMGYDADATLAETAQMIERGGFKARIIACSMRGVGDIQRSFLAGAHIVTTPYKFLPGMVHHPRTIETIQEFKTAWDDAKQRGGVG
ncbi:MAG TPA: transaldolase family protein [Candidatus Latescibacteria bacterium]|jgi:transaldolase|nr:transaldolase family protein [Candidatus Latescibacterota bacterium]HJP32753.1 transaldolase family protein [Candidatus Latescibacterota bacterium]|tara:strand:+ start:52 stop:717 length:666 start_codon:yes stop_codon:yes gene_type:complete